MNKSGDQGAFGPNFVPNFLDFLKNFLGIFDTAQFDAINMCFVGFRMNRDRADTAVDNFVEKMRMNSNIFNIDQFHRVPTPSEKTFMRVQTVRCQTIFDRTGPIEIHDEKSNPKGQKRDDCENPSRQERFTGKLLTNHCQISGTA